MRFMERILVVSSTDKSHTMLAQFLSSCGVQSQLCRAMAGSEARRALVDGEFDLVLVNTPLPDEFGHELAQLAAGETTAGVILLAKAEIADSVAEKVEDDGVFVVPKPLVARAVHAGASHDTRRAQPSERTAKRKPPPPEAHRGYPPRRPGEMPAHRVLRNVRAGGAQPTSNSRP